MNETLKLILSIWIIIVFVSIYILYRINWANKSIDIIKEIVLNYRVNIANNGLYNFKKNNRKEDAIEVLTYLKVLNYTQMMERLLGKNKFFKNSEKLYIFKTIMKPWMGNIDKSILDKALWIKMNNELFGESG